MASIRTGGFGLNYWKLWIASVVSNLGDGIAMVAYPWLASAVTRNPLHIAAVAVITRLPWLLFTLPAGVITDRVDRKRLIVWMDVGRFAVTLAVAAGVLAIQSDLSSPQQIADANAVPPPSATLILVLIYVSAALLGTAEVFRDNAAQTLMPAVVKTDQLEKANGRLWGAEMTMNSFVGPPLAGILIALAFALPFVIDAVSFALAAALVFTITGRFEPKDRAEVGDQAPSFLDDLKEGVAWLWGHDLFRPMAIALGVLNGTWMMSAATYVLFAQEILELDATAFGLLGTGAAVGGIIGSVVAGRVIGALGQSRTLFVSIIVIGVGLGASGLTSSFWIFWLLGAVTTGFGTVWNVITVSLRQSLIPDHLLGRVNSVYRFFGWGMMPIGSLVGGLLVAVAEPALGREWSLRLPFFVGGILGLALFAYALPNLNSSRIDAAKELANAR